MEVPIKAVPDIAIQGKVLAIAVAFVIAWAVAPVQASVISGTYDGNTVRHPPVRPAFSARASAELETIQPMGSSTWWISPR
jgi:hypothetical protein